MIWDPDDRKSGLPWGTCSFRTSLNFKGVGGGMEYVWSQVDRRGDQSLPTELKMGTMKNILPMNYISELSDFITALISIPVTKSTVQQLDFSRTERESSINVTCVLLFRRMNMTLITFSMKPISFFKILWIEIWIFLYLESNKQKRAYNFSKYRF